jgi:pimeloyl-ACP methyl ester carboxylesterase
VAGPLQFHMSKLGNFWKTVLAGSAGMAALAAVNATIRKGVAEPDDGPLGGEGRYFEWKYGRLFFKCLGVHQAAMPLLFVHGISPGISSFMWRKNFEPLAATFPAYALDLLGVGLSDKPPTAPYSADLYVELLSDFIREVVGSPCAIVANALSAAYAVKVADEHPELVRKLILNAPVISDSGKSRPGMAGAAFYGLLQSPVLGTSFYNVMASERSIRDHARRYLFYDHRRITERLIAHLYATSHQPGAQHAMAAFLAGYLNTDASRAFASLRKPIMLVWGKQDLATPPQNAAVLLNLNPRARLEVFDYCRLLPEQEHPEQFNALLRRVLAEPESPAADRRLVAVEKSAEQK